MRKPLWSSVHGRLTAVLILIILTVSCQAKPGLNGGEGVEALSIDKPERLKVPGVVNAVAFSQGGHSLAAGGCQVNGTESVAACSQGLVQFWNVDNLTVDRTLRLPRPVTAVAFSPDGKRWVAGDNEGRLILSSSNGKAPPKPYHQKAAITALAFSPDGKWVASGSLDTSFPLGFFDPSTGGMIKVRVQFDPVTAVGFSPDGKELAIGTTKGRMTIWNFGSGAPPVDIIAKSSAEKAVTALTFSPDGRFVAYGRRDGVVVIWDRRNAQSHVELRNGSTVNALTFSPDGQQLAVSQESGRLLIVNPETGSEIWTRRHILALSDVAYSPDGQSLAVAAQGGLYLYRTGRDLREPTRTVRAQSPMQEMAEALSSGPSRSSPGSFAEALRISQREYVRLLPYDRVMGTVLEAMVQAAPGAALETVPGSQSRKVLIKDGPRSLALDVGSLKADGSSGLRHAIQVHEEAKEFLMGSAGRSPVELEDAAVTGLIRELTPGLRRVKGAEEAIPQHKTLVPAMAQSDNGVESDFDGPVHYLRFQKFDRQSVRQLRAWNDRTKTGIQILDLRNNPGDTLDDALSVAQTLLPHGRLMADVILRRTGDRLQFRADSGDRSRLIVLLVNERTAGTAEMLACVLRDAGVGVLVGSRTAGVDEVYTTYHLPDGSGLRVATARFYCPQERTIRFAGQEVDFEIGDQPVADTIMTGMESPYSLSSPQAARGVFPNRAASGDRQLQRAITVARCLARNQELRLEGLGGGRANVLTALLRECQQNRY